MLPSFLFPVGKSPAELGTDDVTFFLYYFVFQNMHCEFTQMATYSYSQNFDGNSYGIEQECNNCIASWITFVVDALRLNSSAKDLL